jgi:peptidoglycan hydrolase CwlO-like protein
LLLLLSSKIGKEEEGVAKIKGRKNIKGIKLMKNLEKKLKEFGFNIDELKKELESKREKEKKRVYSIYIKSHTDAPDFEQTIEAENVIDALRQLRGWLTDWDDVDILRQIDFPMNNLAEVDKVILNLLGVIENLEIEKDELETEKYDIKRRVEELERKFR